MWVLFAPERRSPSQWPGTARSSASAGRSRMEAASTICPSPLLVVPPLAWRICRVVRRCAISAFFAACLDKETPIDRFVRYLHAWGGRELPLQPARDLLRRPLEHELLRDAPS